MRCIQVFNTFERKDNKDPLIYNMPVPFYAKDQLIQIRRDYCGPNMPLKQV